jgi:hypothetical protein
METTTQRYSLEIRVRGGKLALDDVDVLERIDTDKLDGVEKRVAELVEADAVEIYESSFMDGPHRVYRFNTEDAELAKRYGFEPDEPEMDVYQASVVIGPGNELPEEPDALHAALAAYKADVERAMFLLKLDGAELECVDYDHHYGGSYIVVFKTTDPQLAQQHDFDEVMRAGEEDSEPTPWNWAMQPADDEDRATLAAMIEKATALGIDIEKAYKTYGLVGTETPTTNGQVDRGYCALKYAIDQVEKAQAALKSAQATLAQAVRS